MIRRPKVIHIVTAASSVGLMRGQLAYLREAGFDVYVISSPGEKLQIAKNREKVNVYAVPMEREISPLKDFVALWRLFLLMRRIKPVIVNVGTPKAGLLGGIAAYLARVPCRIYTLRGLRLETAKGFKKNVLYICEKVAVFCAHRVLPVSNSLCRQAVSLGLLDPKKAHVIGKGSSNGIDVSRFASMNEGALKHEKIRCQLGIPEDVPVIGFVGRLTKDKGIIELIKAYKVVKSAFPDVRLILIGRYEEGDPVPQNIREEIKSDKNIIQTGYVNDVAPYYRIMDCLAFPTHREGLGNVALEAAAAGVPVVGTLATGVVDAVIHGETGLLSPIGDVKALADNLIWVLKDENLRKRLGNAGRKYVEEHFQSEYIWQELKDFYLKVLVECGVAENNKEWGSLYNAAGEKYVKLQ
ncbi:glycosyltransferase family 4 protein [Desulfallas thermosapovorans]|uniref:Glycosyltransferase involved in cell wall biosynthesis n=1 Tax=Desulfallas thermosapovorans DSM 6562 TaxID=1121431 RepID=A0A5S4ZNC5_9FIRM|nr:glycosyltransferase family 4 protein [Desulfallas thermosapovorans]TYO93236.1 glycosyltransferase involved in cell wall biosynthesis [Desulfallas thermosapovorans DSM 6562]